MGSEPRSGVSRVEGAGLRQTFPGILGLYLMVRAQPNLASLVLSGSGCGGRGKWLLQGYGHCHTAVKTPDPRQGFA